MTPPYTRQSRRHVYALWLLVAALVATSVTLLLDIRDAHGHHATFVVSTSCADDGTWVASWSITNSEASKLMTIVAEDVTDLAPNPTPYSGTSTDQTSHSSDQVTAHVTVSWPQHPDLAYEATAYRPENCTPSTTLPPTTTTVPGEPPSEPPDSPPAVPVPRTPDFTG